MTTTRRRNALAAIATGLGLALAVPALAQPKAGEPLKIGYIYVSTMSAARKWRRRWAPR